MRFGADGLHFIRGTASESREPLFNNCTSTATLAPGAVCPCEITLDADSCQKAKILFSATGACKKASGGECDLTIVAEDITFS
mmetsp:Transcript_10078/g.25196  ORF Transcript_10078/g.25196 Transcript_10078/m.25196 type:complete len:83 (+) Transcript_10078:349-597(+)